MELTFSLRKIIIALSATWADFSMGLANLLLHPFQAGISRIHYGIGTLIGNISLLYG